MQCLPSIVIFFGGLDLQDNITKKMAYGKAETFSRSANQRKLINQRGPFDHTWKKKPVAVVSPFSEYHGRCEIVVAKFNIHIAWSLRDFAAKS